MHHSIAKFFDYWLYAKWTVSVLKVRIISSANCIDCTLAAGQSLEHATALGHSPSLTVFLKFRLALLDGSKTQSDRIAILDEVVMAVRHFVCAELSLKAHRTSNLDS